MPEVQSPKYRKQVDRSGSARAFVQIDGKRRYLGPYGSPESREAYHRLLAQLCGNGGKLPPPQEELTVVELAHRYRAAIQTRYSRSHYLNIGAAIKLFCQLHGRTRITAIGVDSLKLVRSVMATKGLNRATINSRLQLIQQMFNWGVVEAGVPELVAASLSRVKLAKGEAQVPEPGKVTAVPMEWVEAVKPHLASPIVGLIELQLATGARPGELLKLRPVDIDTSDEVLWEYHLDVHKTAHHGQRRTIYFDAAAQALLTRLMTGRPLDKYLFSPREANAEAKTRGAKGKRRKNQKPEPPSTDRRIGDHYTVDTYRQAIERACRKAFPHPTLSSVPSEMLRPEQRQELAAWHRAHRWHPHQLRHNAATWMESVYDLEVTQMLLGHSPGSAVTKAVYIEGQAARLRNAVRDKSDRQSA